MIVQIKDCEHLKLGEVEQRKTGDVTYRWDISCSYQGKVDMTALSICCRKLDREGVDNVIFKGLDDSPRVRKIVDRELRSADYEFESQEPISVEMTPKELREFQQWKSGKLTFNVEKDRDVNVGEAVTIERISDEIEEREVDNKFRLREAAAPPPNFDQGVQVGDRFKYDGSLCTSNVDVVTAKVVDSTGVQFVEPMKLFKYGHKHFGNGLPFQKIESK